MRRNVRFFSMCLVLAVGAVAIAGAVTHTSSGNWSAGTQTNVSIGTTLELTTVQNQVDDWFRHPWDDSTWEAQGSKETANALFSAADRCLRDSDNGFIDGPTEIVNGHEFRTGRATVNLNGTNYVSTLPPDTLFPLPTGMDHLDGIRFLTSGSRLAGESYVVRFHYSDGTSSSVTVPIAIDTVTGGGRDAAGTNWSIEGFTGLDAYNTGNQWDADGAGGSDCDGNGGDDVIVDNPQPSKTVTDFEFDYTDYLSADAANGWLGGPFAVSLIADEVEIESTFTYRGEYVSASATADAVDANSHAIWYQIQWNDDLDPGSEILLHLTCGDDDNGNGVVAGTELDPEQTYSLSALTSPYTLPVKCHGRYLLYRVELIDEYADDPKLLDITFTYDPDADVDGYGADGNATVEDCDDADDDVHPGATEVVGDEIDQDCDGDEICYDDNDDDGARHPTNTTPSGNTTCQGTGEGRAIDPIDCNDNNAAIRPGATEVTGDGVDQNCDNHDQCYRDADRDGHGTTVVVTAVGLTCSTSSQESTINDDCDDANDDRYPGNNEETGDNVDQNCDNREVCYQDADDDNARHQSQTITTVAGDHNCTGPNEGQATDPVDCNDNDATVSPHLTEVAGNNKDDDCNGFATCYRDVDDDGTRTTVTFQTNDTDCNDAAEGLSTDPLDCDDNDAAVSPLDTEVAGNNKDDDCNGFATCYRDVDNDGSRTNVTFQATDTDCSDASEGLSGDPLDCDDNDPERSPTLTETPGNEKDNDCNGQEICWADADNDDTRHGTMTLVSNDQDCDDQGEQVTTALVDCDDNDAQAYPGNPTETIGNGNDNDCDGVEICYLDNDDDGYRHNSLTLNSTADEDCNDPREGRAGDGVDCDDDVATTNPGAPDQCGNGVDDNCNGIGDFASGSFLDDDADGLEFALETSLGTDDCNGDTDGDNLDDDEEHLITNTSPTLADSDGDGRDDAEEVGGSLANPINTDNDALIDALDPDDDNDGISSAQELDDPEGQDGDGVPNWFDDDSDGDGYSDAFEWTNVIGGIKDTDLDGRNDYVDRDSDNDSVVDQNELGSQTAVVDSDGDSVADRLDADDDDDCVQTVDEVGNPQPGMQSNFDGDALVDYLDDDDDNDGEMSCDEDPDRDGNPADDDTDGDGQKNFKDDEDDGDLIPTIVENAQDAGRDVDFDGLVNSVDTDSDGDGWLDVDETSVGVLIHSDDDGDADFLDLDSDDDRVPDDREGSSGSPIDTDLDGLLDRVDTDDDDDLIPTAEECSTSCGNAQPWDDDFDGDAIADYVDADDDDDHVLTRDEDVNGDDDPRNDNSDALLSFPDGQPDYLDEDDDGDGVETWDEDPDANGNPLDEDTDRDGQPDYLDEDDDGDTLFTFNETERRDFGTGTTDPRDYDFDGDGVSNYLDADDDDDGVDTVCEITSGVSHLVVDNDGDTVLDGEEWENFIYVTLVLVEGAPIPESDYSDDNGQLSGTNCYEPWDRDSDGTINALDVDDDGDGLLTGTDEVGVDRDCLPGTEVPAGDGIPDYLDRDSDNDEVVDGISGNTGTESFGDSDNDAVPDFLDCDDSGPYGDSDLDGILNQAERDLCADFQSDCILNPDVDRDGVIDGLETGLDLTRPLDTDDDGAPDMFDQDDEGDGQLSAHENGMAACVTPVDARFCYHVEAGEVPPDQLACENPPGPEDPGYWRFRCKDELGNWWWFDFGGNELVHYPNTDAPTSGPLPRIPDQVPDFRDDDDDGDGKPTAVEGVGDSDGDGLANAYDADDHDGPEGDADGDGLVTREEVSLGTDPNDPDSDADGVGDAIEVGDVNSPFDHDDDSLLDAVDPDDENDQIPTRVEGTVDVDRDGLPNYLDVDSDGDGVLDREEGASSDTDCDGVWNAYDLDDADGPCVSGAGLQDGDAYTAVGCGCASGGSSGASAAFGLFLAAIVGRRRRGVATRHAAEPGSRAANT